MGRNRGIGSRGGLAILACAALWAWPEHSRAHEVVASIETEAATVISLRYVDGSPLVRTEVQIRHEGEDELIQRSHSDAEGRVAFLPPRDGRYTLRAFTEDGHGAEVSFEAHAAGAHAATSPDRRTERIVLGVGVLLALFGTTSLWMGRQRRSMSSSA